MTAPCNATQTLWDKHLIEQVYFRYCEVIDSKDFNRLDEVFIPEAVGDYRSANGHLDPNLASLVARLKVGMGPQSDCGATHHNVLNIRLEIDGDRAVGRANFHAMHRGANGHDGALYVCGGQYDDQWVRTPDGWRIAHRSYRYAVTDGPATMLRATRPPLA
ncbi:MAG: hypothetical protein JWP35_2587 [Caulobacter sp.]|nr:hypothetical protein [Caulobacter sp.]